MVFMTRKNIKQKTLTLCILWTVHIKDKGITPLNGNDTIQNRAFQKTIDDYGTWGTEFINFNFYVFFMGVSVRIINIKLARCFAVLKVGISYTLKNEMGKLNNITETKNIKRQTKK